MSSTVNEKYLEFATTDIQHRVILSLIETGSPTKTAHELNSTVNSVRSALRQVKAKAALQGYAPEHGMDHSAPSSHLVKGVSTLYDRDGKIRSQWVKTDINRSNLIELAEALATDIATSIEPAEPTAAPDITKWKKDLLNIYPFGDAHIGVYSCEEETGKSTTLESNVNLHKKAIDYLVGNSVAAESAIIMNVGDFVHINDVSNRTPRGNNPLDADGRWHTIVQAARDLLIYMIDSALLKHNDVKLISALGNHDPSTYLINLILAAHYRNEPRVTIDTTPSKFHYHQFGRNMIMVTHSDSVKVGDTPMIMATDQPKMWGETDYRFVHVGHQHHKSIVNMGTKELRGAVVEIHRTLSGGDAWSHGHGYRSLSEAKCITLHRMYGEVGRFNVTPSILEDI